MVPLFLMLQPLPSHAPPLCPEAATSTHTAPAPAPSFPPPSPARHAHHAHLAPQANSTAAAPTRCSSACTAAAPPLEAAAATHAGTAAGTGAAGPGSGRASGAGPGTVPSPQPALLLLPPPPAQLPPRRPRLWHKLWAAAGPALQLLMGAPMPAALQAALAAAGLDACNQGLQGGGWAWGASNEGRGRPAHAPLPAGREQGGQHGRQGDAALPPPTTSPTFPTPHTPQPPRGPQVQPPLPLDAAVAALACSLAAVRVQLQELSVDGMAGAGAGWGHRMGPGDASWGGWDGAQKAARGGAAAAGGSGKGAAGGVAPGGWGRRVGCLMPAQHGASTATLVCLLDFLASRCAVRGGGCVCMSV